jgi:hypothetical protein
LKWPKHDGAVEICERQVHECRGNRHDPSIAGANVFVTFMAKIYRVKKEKNGAKIVVIGASSSIAWESI